MSAFDRIFPLIAGLCLAIWLVAMLPAGFGYLRTFGVISLAEPGKTAVTAAAILACTIFWGLVAVLAKLLFSDWRAGRQHSGN